MVGVVKLGLERGGFCKFNFDFRGVGFREG